MNDQTTPRVAVLGLGLIGSVWAKHLHDDGQLAASWNRTAQPDFPQAVSTPEEAAAKAQTIIVVVSDPAAVESVIDRLLPTLTADHLLIQSSTIGGSDSIRFREKVCASGARYLEAPFTGSQPAARQKKTVFYLGGREADVQAAEPVLYRISANRIHCGSGEQACAVKLAMNLQIAAQAEALSEALFATRAAGVSDDTFFTCMKGNASWSGLSALKEPKLREHNFEPQFSIKHLLKDLRLMKRERTDLPALTMLVKQLEAAADAGRQDEDFISLYKNLGA